MDFPFADAPGIIRANQKDVYIENELFLKIRDAVQSLKGVRFTHNWSSQLRSGASLLYYGLTTLSGSRTLGEEYTDLFYVTSDRRLPSKLRLVLYVLTSGLSPLVLPKLLEKLRTYLRKLKNRSQHKDANEIDDFYDDDEEESWVDEYITPASFVSLNLAIFYFSGAYYQISKRIFGLRYVFGYRVDPMSQPSGSYEIIGFLMAVRALFKLITHIKENIPKEETSAVKLNPKEMGESLEDPEILPFIEGTSRSCHLCYEDMRAPTLTLCGHMYCWSCISDWCREQKVCPLCRQECHEQHLLSLRV